MPDHFEMLQHPRQSYSHAKFKQEWATAKHLWTNKISRDLVLRLFLRVPGGYATLQQTLFVQFYIDAC